MIDLLKTFNNMDLSQDDGGMDINDRVLIIDGMNTFIRSFCAIPTMDSNGNHVGGVTGFLKSIAYTIREHRPTRVFVVFDGKGGSQRRRKVFPEYKDQRKPPTRLNRQYDITTDEEESNLMKYQMVLSVKALQKLPISILVFDHVEADDVMAYLVELTKSNGGESILYSTDKDFIQLVSDDVKLWHPMKKIFYDTEFIVNHFGIHPNNFLIYRALAGDKSDGIPGIKGFGATGAKTALKHFPKLATEELVTVEYLLDIARDSKAVVLQRLAESEDIIRRNLMLMQLSDANFSGNNKLSVIDKFNESPPKFDKEGLTEVLNDYNIMEPLGVNYNRWTTTSFTPLTRYYD